MEVPHGDDGLDWISEYIVAILRAPTFVAPIAKFIDTNCGAFEDIEENKLEYTPTHNAFKELVDEMLTAHLAELSVTTDQFTSFCHRGLSGGNELHRSLVEQLISVDDFLVFKAMMVKRNAELNRETLAVTNATLTAAIDEAPASADADGGLSPEEVQQRRMELVRLEMEQLDAERRCFEAELQLMMVLQAQLEQQLQLTKAMNDLTELVMKMEGMVANADGEEAAAGSAAPAASPQQLAPIAAAALPPIQSPSVRIMPLTALPGIKPEAKPEPTPSSPSGMQPKISLDSSLSVAERLAVAKRSANIASQEASGRATEEEKQARAQHLRVQRERILERKNQERAEQLTEHQRLHGTSLAGRAAQHSLDGNASDAGQRLAAELSNQKAEGTVAEPLPDPEAAALQMRRAIASQLKQTLMSGLS